MDHRNSEHDVPPLGLGVWLRAIVSGLIVMCGVTFVCVLLPFALQLGILGVAFFWIMLVVGLLLGLVLAVLNARQTIRRARREQETAVRDVGP